VHLEGGGYQRGAKMSLESRYENWKKGGKNKEGGEGYSKLS